MKRKLLIAKLRMRVNRIGRHNQMMHGIATTNKVMSSHSVTGTNKCGQNLFNLLPPNMCDAVTNTWFDPYAKDMSMNDVLRWLWDHVVFDPQGYIIAIHDRGEALIYAEGWRDEVEWFCRVKMSEWDKRSL